jgi:hypothetical protein
MIPIEPEHQSLPVVEENSSCEISTMKTEKLEN